MNRFSKISLYAIIFLGILGIFISFVLAQEHYIGPLVKKSGIKINILNDFSNSVCGGKPNYNNCTKVSESEYSTVTGIPVALLGLFYFMVMTLFAVFLHAVNERLRPQFKILFFWYLILGSMYNLVLLGISILLIKAVCSLCLFTYICIWIPLGLLVIYFIKSGENPFKIISAVKKIFAAGRMAGVIKYASIFLFMLVFSTGTAYGAKEYLLIKKERFAREAEERIINLVIKNFSRERVRDLNPSGLQVIGKPGAPVTLIEFSDFMCPSCSRTSIAIEELINENPEKVKLVFMNFPLDKDCNSKLKRQMHPGACRLAKGAICASRQGKFKEFHDTVFGMRLRNPSIELIKGIAHYAGADEKEFEKCMASNETTEELGNQLDEAYRLGLTATPSLFINGKQYRYRISKKILEKIIDHELRNRDMKIFMRKYTPPK